MAKDLRGFITLLEDSAPEEIVRVQNPISTKYEISALLTHLEKRKHLPALVFEIVDGGFFLHREADIVEPFEQAALAERIDLKFEPVLKGGRDHLIFQVDRNRLILGNLQQPVHLILRQLDCQNTILEGVAGEDIGKTGCDHRCQPHVQHGPGGMFAARSAAEIVARDENGGVSEILDIERIPGRRADGFECACTKPFAGRISHIRELLYSPSAAQ